jgi:hypothetical protein
MLLHRKHLDIILPASCFSIILTNNLIESYAPVINLVTKKGEVVEGIVEVVVKDLVSLPRVPPTLENLVVPTTLPAAILSLSDSLSYFFLSISN